MLYLLMQVSNSLIKVCTSALDSCATKHGKEQDQFWDLLSKAVLSEMHKPQSSSSKDHVLISVLNSCLELSTAFKEFVQHLKDTFLQQVHLPSFAGGTTNIHRTSNASSSNRNSTQQKGQLPSLTETGSASSISAGIALSDIERITYELRDFSVRVSKVLDIISTLSQFRQLNMHRELEGLPRVAGLWELSIPGNKEECSETTSMGRSVATSERVSPEMQAKGAEDETKSKIGSESDITIATPDYLEQLVMKQKTVSQQPHGLMSEPLSTLKEESTVSCSVKGATDEGKAASSISEVNDQGTHIHLEYMFDK